MTFVIIMRNPILTRIDKMNRIYLIGDSTCQTNDKDTYPQTGWGQVFSEFISSSYEVINLAKNGRSSKSFMDEGLFKPCENNISNGDFLFIQFGHNDEKEDEERHTDPFTSYQEHLIYYIMIAKQHHATPILLSSIYRRHFDENGLLIDNCHLSYPQAMQDLALRERIIYIDMCNISKRFIQKLGITKSLDMFMNFGKGLYDNYTEGKEDNTHLRYYGAKSICELLVNEINKIDSIKIILK